MLCQASIEVEMETVSCGQREYGSHAKDRYWLCIVDGFKCSLFWALSDITTKTYYLDDLNKSMNCIKSTVDIT